MPNKGGNPVPVWNPCSWLVGIGAIWCTKFKRPQSLTAQLWPPCFYNILRILNIDWLTGNGIWTHISYHISLWLPSMCQSARGPGTRYTRRRIDSLHLWWTPNGSVLSNDCRTLSHCTRRPLLRTCPISILMPVLGWPLCASLTMASSSSLLMLLYVPKRHKYQLR